MKMIDIPPVWLLICLALTWWLAGVAPDLSFGAWARWAGPILVVAGIALMAAAIWQMNRAKTTVIPHQDPTSLVASGIFRYSRNPIYLGDALILTGLILRWDAVLAVPLIPAFVWVIHMRFIRHEERRLEERFPTDFDAYRAATRRWI
ncbi:MAG: isoprenylcysteine carboxylmethyltransferase family protein [Rhodobacter sp.]|nr:isoprenylcysteine carboxylmethyltransferase family protein [Rhodobacter sp.]